MKKTLEQLINLKDYCETNTRGKADTWCDDVKALEIGIGAVERQMPIKTTFHQLGDYIGLNYCKICKDTVSNEDNYCKRCGQKLDWD